MGCDFILKNFKLTQTALMLKPIFTIVNANELRHAKNEKIELDVKAIIKNCHIMSSPETLLQKSILLINYLNNSMLALNLLSDYF